MEMANPPPGQEPHNVKHRHVITVKHPLQYHRLELQPNHCSLNRSNQYAKSPAKQQQQLGRDGDQFDLNLKPTQKVSHTALSTPTN
jgi:hypothetical protein